METPERRPTSAQAETAAESPVEPAEAAVATTLASVELPDTRPSPWRNKTSPLKKQAKKEAKKNKKKLNHRRRQRLLQDCIVVQIPLDVTADLGVAIAQSRTKRVQALLQAFPALKEQQQKISSAKGDATLEDDEEEENKDEAEPKKKARQPLKNVPQPHEFSSVIDYLEAKYVQGVMVDNGQEAVNSNNDDEGQGSVYSEEDDFIDDDDLQRTVAEQVMAHTTTTKLELMREDDSNEFFVNVGTLEVEETDLTNEQYDPIHDPKKDGAKKTKTSRKRKTPANGGGGGSSSSKTNGKTASMTTTSPNKKKKKAKVDENEKPNKKETAAASTVSNVTPSQLETLQETARQRQDACDQLYQRLVSLLKQADLPRQKKKERVALVCPPEKKPGDSVLFANPHVPGQRLTVKIPKNTQPGGTFRVTVPVAPPIDNNGGNDSESKDHNKLSRDFYDALDDFARAFDDACDAKLDVCKARGEEYAAHMEKRKKFDELVKTFPSDLRTPIDKAYLQKILRRARQNKHKRTKTAQRQQEKAGENDTVSSTKPTKKESKTTNGKPAVATADKNKSTPSKASSATKTIVVPQRCTSFQTKRFDSNDF